MSCFQVNDHGRILMSVMQFEFVYGYKLRSLIRFLQFLSFTVHGVQTVQTFFINLFDSVLIQSGNRE